MLTDSERKLRNSLGYSWYQRAGQILLSPELKEVAKNVNARRNSFGVEVYPSREDTFKAFRLTAFEDTKVIILGQDPYHTPGIAHGLAFSSQDPFERPPSLVNILKEVEDSVYNGLQVMQDADLTRWANQGVLLLNTILTVERKKALAHENIGWQKFTTPVLRMLAEDPEPKVFMLWGLAAKASFREAVAGLSDTNFPHLILQAPHPAAESYTEKAGFFGCNHFALANEFLLQKHLMKINW